MYENAAVSCWFCRVIIKLTSNGRIFREVQDLLIYSWNQGMHCSSVVSIDALFGIRILLNTICLNDWVLSSMHKAWDKWRIIRIFAFCSPIHLNLSELFQKLCNVQLWFFIGNLSAIKLSQKAWAFRNDTVGIIIQRDASWSVERCTN